MLTCKHLLAVAKKASKGKNAATPTPKEAPPQEAPAEPPKGETVSLWTWQNLVSHPPGSLGTLPALGLPPLGPSSLLLFSAPRGSPVSPGQSPAS